jgi:CheY-like chemotaxis protein
MTDVCAYSLLLVDDDPQVRDLLTMRLARAHFEVQQAEDGIDALVKLRHKLPAVIITDLSMPGMSGIELISVVRRRFPSIPVIALTGGFPCELPAEAKPDYSFDKNTGRTRDLVQAVSDLARKAVDYPHPPQVIATAVRVRASDAGYFDLTCTDCLRSFQVASRPEDKTVERTAICVHCEARVPFLVESSEPPKQGSAGL